MNNPLYLHGDSPLRSGNSTRLWRRHKPAIVLCGALAAAALGSFLFTGCATGNPLTRTVVVTNEVVTLRTNTVLEFVPQSPQLVYVTNTVAGAPVVVTNTVQAPPLIITNQVPVFVTNAELATNFVVNPALAEGIATARSINSALNATPSAPFVDWGLKALGGALTLFAGYQTRQAAKAKAKEADARAKEAQAQADASLARSVSSTVIRAIETYPGQEIDDVKAHIERTSVMAGTADLVEAQVQATVGPLEEYLADGKLDANELLAMANDLSVKEADVPAVYRKAFTEMRSNVLAARGFTEGGVVRRPSDPGNVVIKPLHAMNEARTNIPNAINKGPVQVPESSVRPSGQPV